MAHHEAFDARALTLPEEDDGRQCRQTDPSPLHEGGSQLIGDGTEVKF